MKNKYFRIHSAYLINKVNLIIIGLVILSGIMFNISSFFTYTKDQSFFNRKEIYTLINSNNILFFKIFFININSFLYGNFFNNNNDLYHLLVPDYKHHKFKYFYTKLLLLILTTVIIIISIVLFSNVFLSCYYSWYQINITNLRLMLNILLLSIIYGIFAVSCSKLINSPVACFIPNMLFIFSELIGNNNGFMAWYHLFIPTIDSTNASNLICQSIYGEWHLLIMIGIYGILSIISYLYVKK